MKTNQPQEERQFARVSRIFPKADVNTPNARVKILATNQGQK